jgi:hypothetical protein
MRRILIDNARRKLRGKHGGGLVNRRADPDDFRAENPRDPLEVMAVHEALNRLAQKSPRKAELVKFRYSLVCTMAEAAQILGFAAGGGVRGLDLRYGLAESGLAPDKEMNSPG